MMISGNDWKQLSLAKAETVKRLITHKEWAVAGDYIGYALECALKAATCRTLNNDYYPPIKTSPEGVQSGVGMKPSHELNVLLVYSGLSDIFNESNFAWQQLSSYYAGPWHERRYDKSIDEIYDEVSVRESAELLYDREDSIIKTLERGGRW